MIIRISTLFAVVVIAVKAGIFVAENDAGSVVAMENQIGKRVSRLIDEAARRRGEIEDAADGVADMAQAIAHSAVSAIVRVIRVIRVAGRTRNRAVIAASVIASRAFRSVLALAGMPYRTKWEGCHDEIILVD
jgi:hypothetical protein